MDISKNHRLKAAFDDAIHRITEGGEDPTEAILKAAAEHSLKPGEARLVCLAHNAGRSISQMEHGDTHGDKVAEFKLADADRVVLSRTVGEIDTRKDKKPGKGDVGGDPSSLLLSKRNRKEASSSYYDRLKAENEAYDAAHARVKTAQEVRDELDDRRRAARTKVAVDRAALQGCLGELLSHFQSAAAFPFPEYERRVSSEHGEVGAKVAAWLHAESGTADKRAFVGQGLACRVPYRPDAVPFSTTKTAVALFRAVEAGEAADRDLAAEIEATYRPRKEAAALPPAVDYGFLTFERPDDPLMVKLANPFTAIGTNAAGTGIGARINPAFADNHEHNLVEDYKKQIFTPEIDHEMKNIRAQALLTGMLTDESSPISTHSPEEVAKAYNQVASFAPQVADQPLSLEPLLNRALKRDFEPFEAKEIADTEKTLRQSSGGIPQTT